MGKTAVLPVKATLNTSPFAAGLKHMKKLAGSFASGLKGALASPFTAIGAGLAGVLTVGAFAHGIKGVLDLGGSMEDLKNQTGESTGNLLLFQQVLKDNGVEAEAAGGVLNKMQKTIVGAAAGTSEMADALGEVSLSYRDLIGLSPVDQFRKIGKAISDLESPLLRAKAARDIFGKQGGILLGALGDERGFVLAANALGRQAQILSANSAAFDQVSDRLGRAGLKLQGFFIGAASSLIPSLDALTAKMDGVDLASQGERFGAAIQGAADYMFGIVAMVKSVSEYISKLASSVKGGITSGIGAIAGMIPGGAAFAGGAKGAYDSAMREAKDMVEVMIGGMKVAGKALEKSMSDAGDTAVKTAEKIKGFVSASSLNTGHSGLVTNGNALGGNFYKLFSANPEMHATSLFGTHNHTPILSVRERRALTDEAVAYGQARPASSAGAYNAVRSGDARRRKEVEKERLKKEQGVDKTNSLLTEILKPTKATADTLKSWDR